ncbi:class A beta-lactamase, subclass A2 [Flavobacterium nitrogenifigens]|uniref:beta-lactamase n=1 Tax=Flavobacterium nitrogenifigens TaxID=1617283 RepID=A0A521CXB6_9FLAO|nr:class A beta-lactamase, subclass A2 [Flavobacterium nitrogenifigens]KAF2332118.1 class A beta-lactamase, subclass A2 [Flavobacterium nitrogenifigens]SMO64064.1 beta-lactamase class A [Flavobacterium nitrogenifigens]
MTKFSIVLFSFLSFQVFSQGTNELRNQLQQIISSKSATLGVSVKGIENKDTLSINGNLKMPMMSVFKFHIALAVLHKVDEGKLNLTQEIFIKKKDLKEDTWSPMKVDYPEGNVNLTLDKILRYTVSHSDNNGCDILINLVGGTNYIQKFINDQGIKDFVIKVNEDQMKTWKNLYVNTTTPIATTELLEKFFKGEILKQETTKYLYQIMVETSRGLTWMKAGLPENTELAHRTGISGTNDANLRVAMNDIGIVKLPNGKHFILSVYLKDITEKREDTEKIIADVTKAVWDYFIR